MNQYARIRKRKPLALRARSQKKRSHRSALAHADGRNVRAYELHSVIDSHASSDRAARTIDVEPDVLLRVFSFKEEKLRDDKISNRVVNGRAYED